MYYIYPVKKVVCFLYVFCMFFVRSMFFVCLWKWLIAKACIMYVLCMFYVCTMYYNDWLQFTDI